MATKENDVSHTSAKDEKATYLYNTNVAEDKPDSSEYIEETSSKRDSSYDCLPRDATVEEIVALPHVADKIPYAAWIVITAGTFERFAYFGLVAPWQNYMQNPRHHLSVPGALGLGHATATNISNAFFLASFLTPMLFGLMSDLWLGRFRTMIIGLCCYLAGSVTLLTTSSPPSLARGHGLAGFIASILLVALGSGSIRATFFPFLGDQYVQKRPQLRRQKNGELVVVDSTLTIQLIYNVYYWFTSIASLSAIPSTLLEKVVDFWAAYLLTTISLGICIAVFFLSSKTFIKLKPKGSSVLPMAARTMLCAAERGFKMENAKHAYQVAHHKGDVPWTDSFVEEVKRGLLACRVVFSLVVFYLCVDQMYNNLVSQAGQMELFGVPNDMIQAFSGIACVLLGPPLQWLYGFLAVRRIYFGPIARISVSFLFCAAGMGYAAIVQRLIYNAGPCYEHPFCEAAFNRKDDDILPNNVDVWVQLPVYFFLAIAEIMGSVSASEYAYNNAPKHLKTVVQAFTQLTGAFASGLGMALSPVAKDPGVLILYATVSGVMAVGAGVFWLIFGKYDHMHPTLHTLSVTDISEMGDDSETEVEEGGGSSNTKGSFSTAVKGEDASSSMEEDASRSVVKEILDEDEVLEAKRNALAEADRPSSSKAKT